MKTVPLQTIRQYIVFIAGGGVGALVNWGISFLLTSLLGMYYLASFLVAQVVNIAVNFTWHRYVTFGVRSSVGQFVRFFLLSSITVVLSMGLVYVCKEVVLDRMGEFVFCGYRLNYLAAIIAVTFLVSLINYVASKLWVFTGTTGDAGRSPG